MKTLWGRNLTSKRLGFVALTFAAVFFASSIQIHRGERTRRQKLESIQHRFEELPAISSYAAEIEALSACESVREATESLSEAQESFRKATESWKKANERAHRVGNIYQAFLSALADDIDAATESPEIYPGDGRVISFSTHGHVSLYAHLTTYNDEYFYRRLALEINRRQQHLDDETYDEQRTGLARALLAHESGHRSLTVSDEHSAESKLKKAEDQVAQMQVELASLRQQIARVERSRFERSLIVCVAILSLLIGLSSHFLAWRGDRRQTREAELIVLRRQEMEQNVIQKTLLIRESQSPIIKPSSYELEFYARKNDTPCNDQSSI